MELKSIQIKNFRSIKDVMIEFDHNCLILLGKNEAGKSNVLKAIAAVFDKHKVSDKDRRKKIDNEKIKNDDYYVRAIISLNNKDIDEIEQRFIKKFTGIENISFKNNIELNDCIKLVFNELIIKINISNEPKASLSFWHYNEKDVELNQNLFLSDNIISINEGSEFNLIMQIFSVIKELYFENPIKCHYWQYNDSYLLPSSVEIQDFIDTPSEFKALENIFQLCGRENIEEEFSNALSEDGDYVNLLEQVSKKVTNTFQKIWNDFKGTSIQLIPDGNQILIKIANKAKYNCEDRSDGFKKFISILLMLSTQSRSKKIKENDLILIDEPDQSLYPTSAQYLRDELLTIAKKSKVIYATHSQYMIDVNNLDSHLIVEKNDDVTTLNKANNKAPFATDELLRRAIGSSIFECIKPINIIFEGYLDKLFFSKFCSFNNKEKQFDTYGHIYLAGISGVDTIVSILDSANKKFIIVADSDETSISKSKEFIKNHPNYSNNWLAYGDIEPSINTLEDFINEELLVTEIQKINNDFEYNTSKNAISNIEKAVNNNKEKKQEIKNNLVANLTNNDIIADYNIFVDKLQKKLKTL